MFLLFFLFFFWTKRFWMKWGSNWPTSSAKTAIRSNSRNVSNFSWTSVNVSGRASWKTNIDASTKRRLRIAAGSVRNNWPWNAVKALVAFQTHTHTQKGKSNATCLSHLHLTQKQVDNKVAQEATKPTTSWILFCWTSVMASRCATRCETFAYSLGGHC